MNFWKKIVKNLEKQALKTSKPQKTNQRVINKSELSGKIDYNITNYLHEPHIRELYVKALKVGHPQRPFLSETYSFSSRVPSFDLSPFIIERLSMKDIKSIDLIMNQLIVETPVSCGTSWISENILKISRANFKKYLYFSDPKAYLELKAMLIILSKEGSDFNFWIINNNIMQMLSWALICHNPIALPSLVSLINKANLFILKLGFELDSWLKFPLFLERQIESITPFEHNFVCLETIKKLPIATRLHLFWAAKKGGGLLPELTTFAIRSFGIEPKVSSKLLIDSGLFIHSDNPEIFSKAFTKENLISFCSDLGIHIKKTWTKSKIVNALKEQNQSYYYKLIRDYQIAEINPGFKEELVKLSDYSEKIVPLLSLVVFSLSPSTS